MMRPPATGPPCGRHTQSDDGGRYRQASTAVVFHPSSQPKRRPPMADVTLSSAVAGATPNTPVPPVALDPARTILALDLGTTTSWAELRGVPYQGVPVGTIKKHATGRGNANKQTMIAAARDRGFSPADDNEADAIAILLWAIETRGGAA